MDDSSVRVSDADRDEAVGVLREHLLAGRLTLEEFSERVEAALTAIGGKRVSLSHLGARLNMIPPLRMSHNFGVTSQPRGSGWTPALSQQKRTSFPSFTQPGDCETAR